MALLLRSEPTLAYIDNVAGIDLCGDGHAIGFRTGHILRVIRTGPWSARGAYPPAIAMAF